MHDTEGPGKPVTMGRNAVTGSEGARVWPGYTFQTSSEQNMTLNGLINLCGDGKVHKQESEGARILG